MSLRAKSSPIVGTWRIVDMEVWDRDAFELEGPTLMTFNADGTGRFNLIAVQGWMDARFLTREGREAVEFSWEGTDGQETTLSDSPPNLPSCKGRESLRKSPHHRAPNGRSCAPLRASMPQVPTGSRSPKPASWLTSPLLA